MIDRSPSGSWTDHFEKTKQVSKDQNLVGSAYKPTEKAVVLFFNGGTILFSDAEAEAIHGLLGSALATRDRAIELAAIGITEIEETV